MEKGQILVADYDVSTEAQVEVDGSFDFPQKVTATLVSTNSFVSEKNNPIITATFETDNGVLFAVIKTRPKWTGLFRNLKINGNPFVYGLKVMTTDKKVMFEMPS